MRLIIEKKEIATRIYEIRGTKVILDRDLSILYQIKTKSLNQAVKRNIKRFPIKYAFQLTKDEVKYLRSQFVTANISSKSRVLPFAFTMQGTMMVASILNSDIAIDINQKVIEAFIEIRQQVMFNPSYELLKEKLYGIESRLSSVEDNISLESMMTSTKVIKLSQEVKSMSNVLDDFQYNNLIIKRPDQENWNESL
jgi:hypothetical protein